MAMLMQRVEEFAKSPKAKDLEKKIARRFRKLRKNS